MTADDGESAEQRRSQIVGVAAAAGHDLPFEGGREQGVAAETGTVQQMRRDRAGHGARRAASETAAARQALVDPKLDPGNPRRLSVELFDHRLSGPAGAIPGHLCRDAARVAGHLGDDDTRAVGEAPCADGVAGPFDRHTQHVEPGAKIRHRGRGEDVDPLCG